MVAPNIEIRNKMAIPKKKDRKFSERETVKAFLKGISFNVNLYTSISKITTTDSITKIGKIGEKPAIKRGVRENIANGCEIIFTIATAINAFL
jgi:hypothetical protein